MATSSLNDFISKVKTEGLLTGTHYYVIFGDQFGKEVSLMCDGVNLPGLNNATTDIRLFGENREVPYIPMYANLDLSFISDREMKVKQYFEQWSNAVVNKTTRAVGYYSDYTKQLDIIVTDKEGKAVYCARVYEAYPKNIQDIRFGFDNKDIIRVNVSLAFKYWTQIPIDGDGNENNSYKFNLFSINPNTRQSINNLETVAKEGQSQFLGGSSGFSIRGPSPFSSNFPQGATALGKDFGAETSRMCSGSYALLSTTPNGNANTTAFGSSILSLGKSSADFGSALSGLGAGISAVTAPAAALGNATSGIANVLGSVNVAASGLGLGSPFSSVQSRLLDLGGKLAVVSNVAGIPGYLGSIGANLAGMGSIFSSLTSSMTGIPGGSQQIADSIGKLGSVYQSRGNDVSASASQLQSDVAQGKYP
jgi:hypothetical protein